jgi:hypothetical protein
MDCCKHNKSAKKCMRKSDKKIFLLPRRFTRKRCKKGMKGFTMKASCAPYKDCKKGGSGKSKKTAPKKSILSKIIASTQNPTFRVTQEKKYLLSTLVDTNEDKAHTLNRAFERKRLIDDIDTKDFKQEQGNFDKLAKKVKTSFNDKSLKMINKSLQI